MRKADVRAVDLNLLVALDALLRERSVSRAATDMGLSQPAMSRALGRLRDLFDDPILVRSGHSMVPTPRALELAAPLGTALEAIRRTLERPGDFEAHTAERSFVLSAVDDTQPVLLPRILGHIRREAPGIEVSMVPLRSTSETFAQLALGEIDLAVGYFGSPPPGIARALLYQDRIVCLARRDHPRVRGRLTMKHYVEEAHLAEDLGTAVERPFTIDSLLAEKGLARRVACTVQTLAIAPVVVARTDLLCSAPGETIAFFAKGLGVRIFDPPFESPGFDLHLAWHKRNDREGGHAWFRNALLRLFRDSRDE